MDHPFVLLVTGPAGAGKTAAAVAWATRQREPTAHVSLDDVRDFMKSGFANPEEGWGERAREQLFLARDGCAALAKLYVRRGLSCVIDDAIFPLWEDESQVPPWAADAGFRHWLAALEDVPFRLVVFFPTFESVLARNEGRSGGRRLQEQTLRQIYDWMLPWREQHDHAVIDNTNLSAEETAEELGRVV